jgi:hypothetical protein
MKAKEFDKKFDDNEDISKYLDVSKAHRPEQEQKRVNVDSPLWMIHQLDREARRLGVSRQSIIRSGGKAQESGLSHTAPDKPVTIGLNAYIKF